MRNVNKENANVGRQNTNASRELLATERPFVDKLDFVSLVSVELQLLKGLPLSSYSKKVSKVVWDVDKIGSSRFVDPEVYLAICVTLVSRCVLGFSEKNDNLTNMFGETGNEPRFTFSLGYIIF